MGDNLSQYKDLFISESKERIQKLNDLLIDYEKKAEKETLNLLMQEAHTLKGMSATMGFNKTAFLCHILEDVFDYARYDHLKIDKKGPLFNALFDAFDFISSDMDSIEKKGKEKDCTVIAANIKKLSGVNTEGTGPSIRDGGKPVAANKKSEDKKSIKPAGKEKKERKKDTVEDIKKVESTETDAERSGTEDYESEKLENVRIKVETLDNLMSITEELIMLKLKLKSSLKEKNWENFQKAYDSVEILTDALQREVMSARLVPVYFTLQRFSRMVRDLAETEKKDIELKIEGSEIEFDRSIVEEMATPLVHILRNAVDHGISEKGTIAIKAARMESYAMIEISDDGVGIDIEEIKRIAIEKGITTKEDLKDMKEQQILSFIYNPKLSTSKKVTAISGRGVGLNVAKAAVERLRGNIEIKTEKGKGTTFILRFPLTLAITNALLVLIGHGMFAVPLVDVVKIVTLTPADIRKIANESTFILGKEDILILFPSELFYDEEKKFEDEFDVLVLKTGEEKFAIKVDGLLGEKEIVVKPMPKSFKNKYISGVTVLEDGDIIPIVNAGGFLKI